MRVDFLLVSDYIHIILKAIARRKGPIAAKALAASKRAEEAQHSAMLCIVRCVAVTASDLGKRVPIEPIESIEIVSVSLLSGPIIVS